MVDVGNKADQLRIAVAKGHISLQAETIELIKSNEMKKGDVLSVAQLSGIQAAKSTSGLIPLCHNIFLNSIDVKVSIDNHGVKVIAEVQSTGKTGVEMEALTAVSISLLTVYDMCKAVDKKMVIDNVELIEKKKI